jgi:hypothetical protein
VKAAIVMQKTGLTYAKAIARLRKAHDSMREALGEDIEPRLRGLIQGHAEGTSVTTGETALTATIPTPHHRTSHSKTRRGRPVQVDLDGPMGLQE